MITNITDRITIPAIPTPDRILEVYEEGWANEQIYLNYGAIIWSTKTIQK